MTHELRDADAGMVAATVNELVKWFCELNYGGAKTPAFSLRDQEAQDALQAERDTSNYEAGARFTNAYWERACGYKPGHLAAPAVGSVPAALPGTTPAAPDAAAFAEAALDSAQLVKLMAAALALAELKGMEAAQQAEDLNVGL